MFKSFRLETLLTYRLNCHCGLSCFLISYRYTIGGFTIKNTTHVYIKKNIGKRKHTIIANFRQ